MKLRNKKTGEIIEKYPYSFVINSGEQIRQYDSLGELYAEWEDYEEPKEYYCIDWTEPDGIYKTKREDVRDDFNKEIGNYFDTREEAEKAVEKLRAWKVLKDMGFKIVGIRYRDNKNYIEWSIHQKVRDDYYAAKAFNEALHLLFGGEE